MTVSKLKFTVLNKFDWATFSLLFNVPWKQTGQQVEESGEEEGGERHNTLKGG